jgi:hypothetical protein
VNAVWVEAVLLAEDLDGIVVQFLPVTIALGAGQLHLSDPAPCVLVPDLGMRVVCKAKVHWPVLGIEVPVTAHSLEVLLRPEIATRNGADILVFKLEIENVDLAGVPKVFDHGITERINHALREEEVELSWDFASTLTHSFALPASISPCESLDLGVVAGRVRIRADGIGLAVMFTAAVNRRAAYT